METTVEQAKPEVTPEQQAVANQVGVIQVVERLFKAVDAGTFPLRAHEDAMAGMSFLAQFHKQLVAQLPEEVRTKLQAEAANAHTPKA
jgi:hypothetical protein